MHPSSLRAASAYADVGIQTQGRTAHDPYQLVVLMFDSVLESIAAARGAMQKKDLNGKLKAVDRAIKILQVGLQTNLDLEKGGELAANLSALYDYCIMRLVLANSRNDETILAEVSDLIKQVAQAWGEIGPGQAAAVEAAPAQSAAIQPAAPVAVAAAPAEAPAAAPTRRLNSIYGGAAAPGIAVRA